MRYCTQILRLFCFQKGHDMLENTNEIENLPVTILKVLRVPADLSHPLVLLVPLKAVEIALMHPTALYVIAVKEIV